MDHSVKPSDSNQIEISVVVPVRDEEDSVQALIEGLLGQTLLPREIVIADGGSVDATREIVAEIIGRGAPVKLVREQKSMPGRARNVGARHSHCDWIAFTDAGTRPAPTWLAALVESASHGSSVDVVYGSYEPIVDSFFKECAAIAYVPAPFASDGGFVRPVSIVSALMRRKVWESVNGFPEHLRSAEDLIFMRRVEEAKFKIARSPEAIVYWNIQPNLWGTFRRFVDYSRNNIRAGLFAEWQGTIFIYYALLAASTLAVFVFGLPGLFAPPLLWLLLLGARATRALLRNRNSYPASYARNLARLSFLVPILATLDAAAFIGSIDWLLRDKLSLTGSKSEDGPHE